ncbi:MAG: prolipoprotein diacylglyceryl transferase [bacterium]
MINWLHTNLPDPIFLTIGPMQIHWYGLILVFGMILAIVTAIKLAKYYNIDKDLVFDLSFWLIILGLIGARLYDVCLEYEYYLGHPLDVFKIWQGGLAIHGAIIAGILVVWYFARKRKIDFWLLFSIIVPAMALALAIGRWGNYFNQELYGYATNLSWGIPILGQQGFFHPTFIYQSIGNFLIFIILILEHKLFRKKNFSWIVISFLIMYSTMRFCMEFLRIDSTPLVMGLRWPQLVSWIIIFVCLIYFIYQAIRKQKE